MNKMENRFALRALAQVSVWVFATCCIHRAMCGCRHRLAHSASQSSSSSISQCGGMINSLRNFVNYTFTYALSGACVARISTQTKTRPTRSDGWWRVCVLCTSLSRSLSQSSHPHPSAGNAITRRGWLATIFPVRPGEMKLARWEMALRNVSDITGSPGLCLVYN